MIATVTPISLGTTRTQYFQTLTTLNKAIGDSLRLEILRLLRTESMWVLELTADYYRRSDCQHDAPPHSSTQHNISASRHTSEAWWKPNHQRDQCS